MTALPVSASSIQPAATTTTVFIGAVSDDSPLYEARAVTSPIAGDTLLARSLSQFFLGGAPSGWIVPVPSANVDLPRALAAIDPVAVNLLAMPDLAAMATSDHLAALAPIASYCARRGAFFIIDPPSDWTSVDAVQNHIGPVASAVRENGAIYWPSLLSGTSKVPASGGVAAVYISTDVSRGVWVAPAGVLAPLADATPAILLNDAQNGLINPLGVNAIRSFPVYGTVVWGARTLDGADGLGSQWKYVPVRRLALFIEASIKAGLQWTVFQPNTEALWANIRATVTSFMSCGSSNLRSRSLTARATVTVFASPSL